MQNQENKDKSFKYFIDGKELDNRTDYLNATMSGDYVSYFDGDSVFSVSFNSFFGENKDNNKMVKREVNGHLSDTINSRLQLSKKINEESLEKYKSLFKPIDQTQYNTLDLCQIKGSSTRHKSQNGEAHKEITVEEKLKIAEGFKKEAIKQLNITLEDIKIQASQSYYTTPEEKEEIKNGCLERLAKISAEKTEKVRGNFYRYISNNPVIEVKQFNSLQEAKNYFTNSEWSEVFYYVYGTSDLIGKDSKIAEKENKTEENLVFPKGSAIHKPKEDIKDDVITNPSRGERETMEYLQGIKESNGKTDYSEIDWDFIESLAKRMNKNKGKYEAGNYKKPMNINLLKQSLLRHTIEVLKDNYQDDEDDLGHLSAIALNAQFLYYQLKNNVK